MAILRPPTNCVSKTLKEEKSIDWPKKLETSIVQPSDRKIVLDFRKKQMH